MPLEEKITATRLIADALSPFGMELAESCAIALYDARAPALLRSGVLFPAARGVVVVGSAGRALWRIFRGAARWDEEHPLDAYVDGVLQHADEALRGARIGFRRFEPTLAADPALDFRALGELVGLGSMGPFGMLIHAQHGAWWALRGAYLVDAEVDPPSAHVAPCVGCAAPCVGGALGASRIADASPEVRARCVLGQASRYEAEQIAYHYDRDAARAKLSRE